MSDNSDPDSEDDETKIDAVQKPKEKKQTESMSFDDIDKLKILAIDPGDRYLITGVSNQKDLFGNFQIVKISRDEYYHVKVNNFYIEDISENAYYNYSICGRFLRSQTNRYFQLLLQIGLIFFKSIF